MALRGKYRVSRCAALLLLIMLLLFACNTQQPRTKHDWTTLGKGLPRHVHWIRKGDTLYSIAWQYGLDYKKLASWNAIDSPYVIYPGKQIILVEQYRKRIAARKKYTPHKPARTINKPGVSGSITASSNTRPMPKKVVPVSKLVESENKQVQWQWPVKGKVVQNFIPQKQFKGIDISAPAGTKIRAASAGQVVYRGSSLKGYGNLLIIKHNKHFFSAYGHNRKLLVLDQEKVQSGQLIALMGQTESDTVKLHFEIREDGKPVNPLKYLPAQ